MLRSLVSALLAVIVSSYPAERVLANGQASQDISYPIIGQFKLREYRVAILSAANAQLYSIFDASGATLATNLAEEQFAERYPQLFELLQSATGERGPDMLMMRLPLDNAPATK